MSRFLVSWCRRVPLLGSSLRSSHSTLLSYLPQGCETCLLTPDRNCSTGSVGGISQQPDEFGSLPAELAAQDSRSRHLMKKQQLRQQHELKRRQKRNRLANEFGTLAAEQESKWRGEDKREEREKSTLEGQDDPPYRRLSSFGRKNTPYWYAKKIEWLGKKGQVKEAINTLEMDMLVEDRVMPTVHVYSALIGILGRVGYTKKAFKLFNQMKKRGLVPDGPVYTGLFNACANSPWRKDGLARADYLRGHMREKEVLANLITYKAIVKVYALHGELQKAFSVVDECVRQGHILDKEVFSFLLMACISDRNAGFKHAIEVWRVMRKYRITPDTFHYNLLLRTVRDCGIGSHEFANTLVGGANPARLAQTVEDEEASSTVNVSPGVISNSKPSDINHNTGEVGSGSPAVSSLLPGDLESVVSPEEVPNILNPRGKWRHVVGLALIEHAHQRLALLGGCEGLLSHMKKDGATADVKTFTQLLDVVPSGTSNEQMVIEMADDRGVKLDTDFFSLLMRLRNLRGDFNGAKDLLQVMMERKLYPNIRTFGCLAMGCVRMADGLQLIDSLQDHGLVPNVEVFNILFRQSGNNFSYKMALCKLMKKHAVLPEERTLRMTENKIHYAKHMLLKAETGDQDVPPYFKSRSFRNSFKNFMLYYKQWLQEMEVDVKEHPWSQFSDPAIPQDDSAS